MLTRIVKMTFQEAKVKEFLKIFETEKEKIRAFDGCNSVELLNDIHHKNIFFTRSIWQSEEHLDKYRNSALFRATWSKTKKLFAEKPEAWSLMAVSSECAG